MFKTVFAHWTVFFPAIELKQHVHKHQKRAELSYISRRIYMTTLHHDILRVYKHTYMHTVHTIDMGHKIIYIYIYTDIHRNTPNVSSLVIMNLKQFQQKTMSQTNLNTCSNKKSHHQLTNNSGWHFFVSVPPRPWLDATLKTFIYKIGKLLPYKTWPVTCRNEQGNRLATWHEPIIKTHQDDMNHEIPL